MLEIVKIAANWGFPAFFCILFYFDFRKKIVNLDKTVTKDSENTEKVEKTIGELKDIIKNGLIHSIDRLTAEVSRLNGKK